MKYIRLFEDFQLGDLNFMSPKEIQDLFIQECGKKTPDLNLIRVIVDNGLVDVNAKGILDRTPLTLAVRGGNIALAEYLISVGADVNAKDDFGELPLHWAVYMDNLELTELLISAGADVNTLDNYERSPLHWAVDESNIALAEYLISAGADVNAKNRWGETPLYRAVRIGHKEMKALLKQHGAVE